MELKISDVLDRAADKIAPEGAWTQGAWARTRPNAPGCIGPNETNAKCWCMGGAVRSVAPYTTLEGEALDRLRDYCREVFYADYDAWNDAPERTQQEVVTALREAARREREAGR
jgi:hypothetical protein